jgi:hypothetical protein
LVSILYPSLHPCPLLHNLAVCPSTGMEHISLPLTLGLSHMACYCQQNEGEVDRMTLPSLGLRGFSCLCLLSHTSDITSRRICPGRPQIQGQSGTHAQSHCSWSPDLQGEAELPSQAQSGSVEPQLICRL